MTVVIGCTKNLARNVASDLVAPPSEVPLSRGNHYTTVQGIRPDLWKWKVQFRQRASNHVTQQRGRPRGCLVGRHCRSAQAISSDDPSSIVNIDLTKPSPRCRSYGL